MCLPTTLSEYFHARPSRGQDLSLRLFPRCLHGACTCRNDTQGTSYGRLWTAYLTLYPPGWAITQRQSSTGPIRLSHVLSDGRDGLEAIQCVQEDVLHGCRDRIHRRLVSDVESCIEPSIPHSNARHPQGYGLLSGALPEDSAIRLVESCNQDIQTCAFTGRASC